MILPRFSKTGFVLKLVACSHLDLATGVAGGETQKGNAAFIKITGGSIISPLSTDTSAPILSLEIQPGGWDYPTPHAADRKLALTVDFVALLTDTKNELFKFNHSGLITINEEVVTIMSGVGTKSTSLGAKDAIETITCQTNSEK